MWKLSNVPNIFQNKFLNSVKLKSNLVMGQIWGISEASWEEKSFAVNFGLMCLDCCSTNYAFIYQFLTLEKLTQFHINDPTFLSKRKLLFQRQINVKNETAFVLKPTFFWQDRYHHTLHMNSLTHLCMGRSMVRSESRKMCKLAIGEIWGHIPYMRVLNT